MLGIDKNAAEADLAAMHRQGQKIEPALQSQAQWFISCKPFQDWFHSSRSDAIIVDGNADGYGASRCSPMSLVCSSLINILSRQEEALVLHFFCGAHNQSTGESGPVYMMKSLIVQLLRLKPFNLSFIDSQQWKEGLASNSVAYMCRLFKALAKQVFDQTLFCIIDGVSLYETNAWCDDTRAMLWEIRSIAEDPEMEGIFKLLVTSPSSSRVIREDFAPDSRIRIPKDSSRGRRPLTSRGFTTAAQRTRKDSGMLLDDHTTVLESDDETDSSEEGGCE